MNTINPIELLRVRITEMGTAYAVAKDAGMSESYISLIVNGLREPNDHMLAYLGLRKHVERIVTYTYIGDEQRKPPKPARRRSSDRAGA